MRRAAELVERCQSAFVMTPAAERSRAVIFGDRHSIVGLPAVCHDRLGGQARPGGTNGAVRDALVALVVGLAIVVAVVLVSLYLWGADARGLVIVVLPFAAPGVLLAAWGAKRLAR